LTHRLRPKEFCFVPTHRASNVDHKEHILLTIVVTDIPRSNHQIGLNKDSSITQLLGKLVTVMYLETVQIILKFYFGEANMRLIGAFKTQ